MQIVAAKKAVLMSSPQNATREDHICPTCRLLQRSAARCRACDTPLKPLDRIHFDLEETVHQVRTGRRGIKHRFPFWRGLLVLPITFAAAILTTVLIIPWLLRINSSSNVFLLIPLLLVLETYVFWHFFPAFQRITRLSATSISPPTEETTKPLARSGGLFATRPGPKIEPHRPTLVGVARAFGPTITPWRGKDGALLATALSLGPDDRDGTYVRTTRSVAFLLVSDEGQRAVIEGELWLLPSPSARTETVDDPTSLAASLGIHELPSPLRGKKQYLLDGDRIEARGRLTQETVAALSDGYRDSGLTDIFRGDPGHPVVLRGLPPRGQ